MLKNRTIIISNRLPIRIERHNNDLICIPSEGGLATGLGSVYKLNGNVWVGWPGIVPNDEAEAEQITALLKPHNLVPIFLTEEEIQGYYEGFSNEILWPIFHYRPSYAQYNSSYWELYQQVNEKFAAVAHSLNLTSADNIWIHDYQLMLLPQMIRNYAPASSIGYFQHIPFPADEVFRNIPWKDELLKGVLGADLIGFHTYNDTLHFFYSCTHILGVPVRNNSIQMDGRSVYTDVFPMGIDYEKFNKLSQSDSIRQRAKEIRSQYADNKFILSIDRLDYSKGIIERLEAYESLLTSYPDLYGKVVLYMLVVPSRDSVPQYMSLRDDIDRRVGHINAVYGDNEWLPIAYFYNSFPEEELSALYLAADVCLVTPLRDGMNLVSKEYVASKETDTGVLILSELAGAAKELTGALIVNPNATAQIREALKRAIEMPEDEQRQRMDENLQIVRKFNIQHWVKLFLKTLHEVKLQQKRELSRKISASHQQEFLLQFKNSNRRLFLLDYDGTLVDFKNDAMAASPGNGLYEMLTTLKADPKNLLIIISGRPMETMDAWFAQKGYFVVAEHGAWQNYPDYSWHSKKDISTRWKIPIQHVLEKFTFRTVGSLIEEKTYSLAWHYRKVQAGLGTQRAHELADNLRYLLQHYALHLLHGDQVIEIKSGEVNKGKAAKDIIAMFNPDFIFAMGDDITDEDMFQELPAEALTVKVGNKKTAARYFVENQQQALSVLNFFVNNIDAE
ncbi:bifunctional alpha,alpha-trehalose-phosphate synthase (UDP-forming)/trehalose-phosphatase [Sphingobacterium sp. Mn56C]|uniref:bifunctional alpha,alpha-trehalose-phosphate synthase (UDP-forming)/trehalose-phosphatase n=1 Tax=Sphingobacterium sp. Mn56C TaxID=3395261 RepID=UPI003BDF0C63